MDYTKHMVNRKATPQSQPIPGREADMTLNNAGGYSFSIDEWAKLRRFLILGTEGGSYYVGEGKLTREAAANAIECIKNDTTRVVYELLDVSTRGLSAKQDTVIFCLALVFADGNLPGKAAAVESFNKIVRTASQLFQFLSYVKSLRGYGRAVRRAIKGWYLALDDNKLAYQIIKYRNRNGFSHRDALLIGHVKAATPSANNILRYAVKGINHESDTPDMFPPLIHAVESLKIVAEAGLMAPKDVNEVLAIIREHNVPREGVPTEYLGKPDVWKALAERMPMHALIRNLGNLSKHKILGPFDDLTGKLMAQLASEEALQKARVHPLQLLIASATYGMGRGLRGKGEWEVNAKVMDALHEAFLLSFKNVQPIGKKIVTAIDTSGSMSQSVNGVENLLATGAAAAIAMLFAQVEPNTFSLHFNTTAGEFPIMKRDSLNDVADRASRIGGGTDLSAPVRYMLDRGLYADAIIVLTDNETWHGSMHQAQAIKQYRAKVNPGAKLIIASTAYNGHSVGDPKDELTLNVIGFDASIHQVISEFIKL